MSQATEAEQKDDREILCGEIFSDVTGELDELAQGEQENFLPKILLSFQPRAKMAHHG